MIGMFTDKLYSIQQIADIVRKYRNEKNTGEYEDIKGLCRAATLDDIRANSYSLTPGRYVGVEVKEEEYDFNKRLIEFNIELKNLNKKAADLEKKISNNINGLIK